MRRKKRKKEEEVSTQTLIMSLLTPNTSGHFHLTRWAGRHRVPSGMGPSHPGELFNPASNRTRATRPRELVVPAGPRTQAGVVRESWSDQMSWATRRPSDLRQSRPGYLVDPRGLGPGPDSHGTAGRPREPSDPG